LEQFNTKYNRAYFYKIKLSTRESLKNIGCYSKNQENDSTYRKKNNQQFLQIELPAVPHFQNLLNCPLVFSLQMTSQRFLNSTAMLANSFSSSVNTSFAGQQLPTHTQFTSYVNVSIYQSESKQSIK